MKFSLHISLIISALSLIGCDRSEEVTQAASEDKIPQEMVSAEESLQNFLRRNGLEIGLNAAGKSILQIGVESVRISLNQTANFEAKRRAAYDVAFKRALRKIMEIMQCEVKDEEGLCRNVAEETNSESTSRLITKTCKGVVYGFRVLNQMESYDEGGNFQIAVLVAWSKKIQDSIDAACDSANAKIGLKPGNVSLEDWVRGTDLALNLGYLLYVDSNGVIWSIGVAFSGEAAGKEAKAKGEALRWASYARGCGLSAEVRYRCSLDGDMSSFDERICVEPLRRIDIFNKSIKWFDREVISPVSGCNLKAIVCAIPCSEI